MVQKPPRSSLVSSHRKPVLLCPARLFNYVVFLPVSPCYFSSPQSTVLSTSRERKGRRKRKITPNNNNTYTAQLQSRKRSASIQKAKKKTTSSRVQMSQAKEEKHKRKTEKTRDVERRKRHFYQSARKLKDNTLQMKETRILCRLSTCAPTLRSWRMFRYTHGDQREGKQKKKKKEAASVKTVNDLKRNACEAHNLPEFLLCYNKKEKRTNTKPK